MLCDHIGRDRIVSSQSLPHRVRGFRPQAGGALDVGHQERHYAGWEVHRELSPLCVCKPWRTGSL